MPIIDDAGMTYSLPDQFHSGLTIRGLLELWLTSLRQTISTPSYTTYERIVKKHILPVLGDTEVDYLTATDIRDFLQEKRENGRLDERGGLSQKTVGDISRVLRSALKLVNWDDRFSKEKHEFIRSQHDKRDIETLTDAQAQELIQYLVYYIDRSNAGFLLCLFTGIKLSEVCALKDLDFDLSNNRLYIHRVLQRVTMRETPTEERDSRYTVDYGPEDAECRQLVLPAELSNLLQPILKSGEPDAYFLTGETGAPLGPRTYQYRFQSVLSNCGLPSTISFYVLRNTFALMWLLRGGDVEGLSRALGHASAEMTVKRYSKLMNYETLHFDNYVQLLVGFYPGL